MGIELLTERHASQIAGLLGCYDRMLIFGTLPGICYAGGMTSFLYARQVRIFDYPKFAEPFRERIRENTERMAAAAGIEIEFIRTRSTRKEDRAQEILAKRGAHLGLVCILSAMEPCSTYKPWHNKQTGKTYLAPNDGKCLHYYFYFVDEELGFCHVRVPTWLPCRLQICLNGHNWLAGRLRQAGIEYRMADNAFTHIGDWQQAQTISDGWKAKRIHEQLNITDEEKAGLIAASDIFVLPSDNMQECFGLAPVEAMASGIPQVVSDWDGYRETVVHGQTGFLVPTCWTSCESDFEASGFALGWQHDQVSLGQSVSIDLRLLQEYLQHLISNPTLRASMGAASRARAVELFSLAAVARCYDGLWSELTEVARAIRGTAAQNRFDQPSYFKTFAHYASTHLAAGDCLSLGGDPPGDITSLVRDASSELALPTLNTDLLERLIEIVRASTSGIEAQSTTVGHLVAAAEEEGFTADRVGRHILWLLKYGFLHRGVS